MNNFCTDGSLINPKCYTLESFQFDSEEQIFDILLDIFKSELPPRLALAKDCQGKPMYIAEESIDIIPPTTESKFQLILNPLGDIPEYSENLAYRKVEYNFELLITAQNTVAACVTWELVRFKNIVEGLIIGAELAIDGYHSVYITPKGFNYFIPEAMSGAYRRQGSYRFSVTVTQYKIQ